MTPNHIRLVVTGAAVLSAAVQNRINARTQRRFEKVSQQNAKHIELCKLLLDERAQLTNHLETAETRMNYLIDLLQKHDVPVDDFDLIVINSITQ
jgi:hypothetical protein